MSETHNMRTEIEMLANGKIDFLQQKFETNVEALDKLLSNYNKELTNLKEFIQRDVVFRSSQCQASSPEKSAGPHNITKPPSNKLPPKPLPKPKTKPAKNGSHDTSETNRKPDLQTSRPTATCRASRTSTNICNRTTETLAPDYKSLLQRSYSQLLNYISCTQDIAARLFQNQMLTLPELDSIQKTRTMGRANENLLNILLRKPIEVYHVFLTELQRTHQSHVLSMLANTESDFFGCECSAILHHSKLIRQHYVDLTESIEVEESGLLNHLVAGNVITEREKEDIATEWNKYRQAESLLGIIARKSAADYAVFLQALVKTNQKHISDILQGIQGSDSSQNPQNLKICTTLHTRRGTNEKASAKPKRRFQGSWLTGPRLPCSIRIDISAKILALHRTESKNVDCNHIDNLLKGFVQLRKTAYSMETERLNKEKETEEVLTRNSELTVENNQLEYELRKVRRDAEWLQAELDCFKLEMQKSRLQQTDKTIEKDRLQSHLKEAEVANERLKRKLLEAANEIKRRRDVVLDSDEFKQLKQDRDRIEQRLNETDKELGNQKRFILKEKELQANEREWLLRLQSEVELQMKHLNSETDSRLAALKKQADEDKENMKQFCNEIRRLEMRVNELENENHQLLNELNIERERHSKNEHIRNTPRYQVNHVGRLEIGGSWVEGAAVLDNRLYVACRGSGTLVVYSTQQPHTRQYSIQIPGMTGPIDIVACNTHRCLYVSDLGSTCVWQVKADHKSYKWLSNATWPYTLSVTREGFVLMARRPSNLNIYAPCANLVHSIRLPDVVLDPCHAVETSEGTYLVSHGEKLSHRHSVTELTREGRILRSYGGPLGQKPRELDRPRYLAVDGHGNVLIADYGNNRIVMLDSDLNFADILLTKDDNGIKNPHRISFHDNKSVSVISGGIVDLYSLTNSSKAESSNL